MTPNTGYKIFVSIISFVLGFDYGLRLKLIWPDAQTLSQSRGGK